MDQLLNGGGTQGDFEEEIDETVEPTPEPTPTPWGGVDAGEGADVHMGKVIQIGDSAFNRLVLACKRLMTVVMKCEGMANKDLSKFEGQKPILKQICQIIYLPGIGGMY